MLLALHSNKLVNNAYFLPTDSKKEPKLKYLDGNKKSLHPQYVFLRNRLEAIESAIKHFLGEKELLKIRVLYEKEFTDRILQARDH